MALKGLTLLVFRQIKTARVTAHGVLYRCQNDWGRQGRRSNLANRIPDLQQWRATMGVGMALATWGIFVDRSTNDYGIARMSIDILDNYTKECQAQ